ncbi:hypothetical protein [Pseudoalteromonas ulvae]|uniref:hypothetical protein n=1 Tax=Pseudoalteromonas ulvae TaxID=107327 RepID=UPI00186B720F|nr:hypothetical protein [Pseudoalteromonas ulvae]
MAPPFKKFLIVIFVLGVVMYFWSSECEDCTKSTQSIITAYNLTQDEVKYISTNMFDEVFLNSLKEKYPKYAKGLKDDRIAYNIRTKINTTDNTSVTKFSIGFKYSGLEGKNDPEIVKDAEAISKILGDRLFTIVKPYEGRESLNIN